MIRLDHAKKIYTTKTSRVSALDDVSLDFSDSGFVCVLGPSGCGKTTLLNILGGLDELSSGGMSINDADCTGFNEKDWNEYRNGSVGFVFQQCCLIPRMSLLKNVELTLAVSGMTSGERKIKAMAALAEVGISDIAGKTPDEVSGGQLQRAAIARAVVNDPSVVLADEPTGSLDSVSSENIMRILKKISQTKLVVMVTHNRELAEKYATRIIEMSDGKIISDTGAISGPSGTAAGQTPARINLAETAKLAGGNLLSKKLQTAIITAVGSIGIVGVCIVLALSAWFGSYVDKIENDMLSMYGITAGGSVDLSTVISAAYGVTGEFDTTGLLGNDVYVNTIIRELYESVDSSAEIDESYLDYLKQMPHGLYRYMMYDYGMHINSNIFTEAVMSGVNLTVSLDYITNLSGSYSETVQSALSMLGYFSELPDNQAGILKQYDLVYGGYPSSKDQLVFVINENDTVYDYAMALLGYYSFNEISDYFAGNLEDLKLSWSYEELTAKKFSYFNNDLVYKKQSSGKYNIFTGGSSSARPLAVTEGEGVQLSVAGVLKNTSPDAGLASGLYYTKHLADYARANAAASNIVKDMLAAKASGSTSNPYTGERIVDAQWQTMLRALGGNGMPMTVDIFASSVGAKSQVLSYLKGWNDNHPDTPVKYVDNVGTVTSLISSVIGNATVLLVVLTGISLIITAVMTGIVSFMSVKERKKEIGILRCIGARRMDIARMFSIETALTGLVSGILGIIVAYAALWIVGLTGAIALVSVATLPWWQALICVAASMLLSLAAGLIPSLKASHQNPVEALRSD